MELGRDDADSLDSGLSNNLVLPAASGARRGQAAPGTVLKQLVLKGVTAQIAIAQV